MRELAELRSKSVSRLYLCALLAAVAWTLIPDVRAQDALPVIYRGGGSEPQPVEHMAGDYLAWLQQRLGEEHLPGMAAAVVSREAVIDLQTWGVRSEQGQDPVDPDSLFRIASVSKTFAGTVASLLVNQHLQDWDTPIKQVLPSIQLGTEVASQAITLRNLVSHTTGLMPHAYSNMLDAGVAYDKIQEKFNEIPTVCPPGRCYGYQNVVFSLIADLVQTSTRKTYEEYLDEQVFRPLGMKTASTGLEKFQSSSDATAPHRLVRGEWRLTTLNPAYYSVAPAAGINASIIDMSIWARANMGAYPNVLSEDFLRTQHDPVVETPHGNYFNRWDGLEHAYYALGWRVFDYRGLRVVHHGGGVRGYRSEIALVPDRNLGLVVLFNAETKLANDVVPAFLDRLVE